MSSTPPQIGKNTFNAEDGSPGDRPGQMPGCQPGSNGAVSAEPDVISLRVLRALRVKLSGWVGLFPDPPFTGLRRKLFSGGLKFWVVGSGTFFAKPRKSGSSRTEDVS